MFKTSNKHEILKIFSGTHKGPPLSEIFQNFFKEFLESLIFKTLKNTKTEKKIWSALSQLLYNNRDTWLSVNILLKK